MPLYNTLCYKLGRNSKKDIQREREREEKKATKYTNSVMMVAILEMVLVDQIQEEERKGEEVTHC